ncbi:hypothetical protein LCGC14_1888650 [marine sediment metagenome]|uniref:Uncharacterized protein n=1 Tax=marine sediment metagenome TaxID=412755 RepID=A0A0F9G027_9ZZZZ
MGISTSVSRALSEIQESGKISSDATPDGWRRRGRVNEKNLIGLAVTGIGMLWRANVRAGGGMQPISTRSMPTV